MVGDGSYLMMAQEIVTAVAEGVKLTVVLVQNHGFASIGALSESRRLAALRHRATATARHRHSTATAAGRPRRQRREPRRRVAARDDRRRVRGRAARGRAAAERTTVVQVETDPLVPAPDARRRGGTCRSPRSPRSTATRAARADYERDKRAQQPLPDAPPRRVETPVSTTTLEDHPAPHRRRARPPAPRPAPRRSGTRRRASSRPRCCWPSRRRRRRRRRPPRPRSRPGATCRCRAARGSCSRSATWSSAHIDELARIIASEHGKVLDDAKGEIIRGLEVVEYACGLPQLLKGEYSDQVSTDVDAFSLPAAARRLRRDHAVQLPGHGPDVDAPDGDRVRATRSCSSRPSATRRRRTSSPSSTPRPGCPTACSTSCTATRSPSTRCSTTRTSRRSRSSARRRSPATCTRRATAARQARAGARRRQEPRRRDARRRPRLRRQPPDRRGLRLGRPALHGDLGRGRGRRRRRRAGRAAARRRRSRSRSGRGSSPTSEMGPVVTAEARDRIVGYIGQRRGRGADGRGRRPRRWRSTATASSSARRCSTTSRPTWTSTRTRSSGPCSASSAWTSLDEAIDLINANPYANGTAIFTVERPGRADVPARASRSG